MTDRNWWKAISINMCAMYGDDENWGGMNKDLLGLPSPIRMLLFSPDKATHGGRFPLIMYMNLREPYPWLLRR